MFLDVLFRQNFELEFAMNCAAVDPREQPIDFEPISDDEESEESDSEELAEPVAGAKRNRDADDDVEVPLGAMQLPGPEPKSVKYDTLPDGVQPGDVWVTGEDQKVTVLQSRLNHEATPPKLVPPGVIRDVLRRHCEKPDAVEDPVNRILASRQEKKDAENARYLCLEVMQRPEVATDFAAVCALNIVLSTAQLIMAVNESKRAKKETTRRNRIAELEKLSARVAKHNAKIEADGEKVNRKTIVARDNAVQRIKDLKRLLGTPGQ